MNHSLSKKFRVVISEPISNRATINSSFVFTPEEFIEWFSDIQAFYAPDRHIGDCEGNTLLEKVQSWFKYLNIQMEYASCN